MLEIILFFILIMIMGIGTEISGVRKALEEKNKFDKDNQSIKYLKKDE